MGADTQGTRLKKVRKFRGFTQKELGNALGLGGAGDIRIAQYESSARHPKADMIIQLAQVLKVTPYSIDAPVGASVEEFMQSIFWAEEFIGSGVVRECFKEWSRMRAKLECGEISKEEYFDWKLTWTELALISFSARNKDHGDL